jgi:hypothetical protein
MRILWTFVKIVLALALAIPLSILVLATALGVFGALVGLAFIVLKLAVFGLVGYGAFRLISRMFRGPAPKARPQEIHQLPAPDPHYEAAMRELDRELGETRP